MARVKLRCIMGCPGLKRSYWEKGLLCNHFFQTLDLFSGAFEVFNEMEMEINVINNKMFRKNIFKNKSKWERNFIIYHFLIESRPHERTDLLITVSVNIYQTKKIKKSIPTVMKTCFSERKLMEQFGNSPFQLTPYF